MKRIIKGLWHRLCKISLEIGSGCALMECPCYYEEARKEILKWGFHGENKKEEK